MNDAFKGRGYQYVTFHLKCLGTIFKIVASGISAHTAIINFVIVKCLYIKAVLIDYHAIMFNYGNNLGIIFF